MSRILESDDQEKVGPGSAIGQVCESIQDRLKWESENVLCIQAVGRVDALISQRKKLLWLTNVENKGTFEVLRNVTGGAVGTYGTTGTRSTYPHGTDVYKNTIVGDLIARHGLGWLEYTAPDGNPNRTFVLDMQSKSSYTPVQRSGKAVDVNIELIGHAAVRGNELSQLLEHYRRDQDRIAQKQKEIDRIAEQIKARKEEERGDIDERLRKLEDERDELRNSLKKQQESIAGFIRKQQDLRSQHILDPHQSSVKSAHLFDGRYIVLDGGPGTGKTTTLIQRIKFLTATSILEHKPDLTAEQYALLSDERKNWIFFSPSPLLREYLRSNMENERLNPTEKDVLSLIHI